MSGYIPLPPENRRSASVLREVASHFGAPTVHDITDKSYERLVDHGTIQTLWYSDGSVGVRHECHRQRDDRTLIHAPRLQLDAGHVITSTDPVTVTPSIMCDDCGLHGFLTDGVWRDC